MANKMYSARGLFVTGYGEETSATVWRHKTEKLPGGHRGFDNAASPNELRVDTALFGATA
jgi:hypothetical protein